jgi:hypothetical protein
VNGIKLAGSSFGISAIITFSLSLWNNEGFETACKNGVYDGLKVGGIAWVSSILSAQLGRTHLEQGLRGTTDFIVKQVGSKTTALVANALRASAKDIYGAAAANYVSKLLRGNIVTGAVTTLALSSVDLTRMFNGKISGAQTFKNITNTATSVAGGTAGWMAGAVAGSAVGSAVPLIGTVIGGIVGGFLGSFAGGTAANSLSSTILDNFIEDDAKEMSKKLENIFGKLAEEYLLNEKEADIVIEELQKHDISEVLRDMYSSNNRSKFCENLLIPLITKECEKRKQIKLSDLPTYQQACDAIKIILNNTDM